MAEERQPSTIREGEQAPEAVPAAAAEDRKAAAALESLDARGASEGSSSDDTKALGDAMQSLGVGGKASEDVETKKKAAVAVKVEQADVTLLVEQLDLSKVKATELLKAHEADPVRAMAAWVTASA